MNKSTTKSDSFKNLQLLFKARSRYENIAVNAQNPQVAALVRMLEHFKDRRQNALIFYATENPRSISKIVDEEIHRKNLNTLASISANVTTVATNISGVNSFAERYRVDSSDPSSSLDAGDLAFNTSSNVLNVGELAKLKKFVNKNRKLAFIGQGALTTNEDDFVFCMILLSFGSRLRSLGHFRLLAKSWFEYLFLM